MNRNVFSILLLVGLSALAGFSVSSGLADPAAAGGKDAEKLAALRKERRDVLEQATKQVQAAYQRGVVEYESIPRILVELLNAELELAPDRAARIAVREKILEQFKKLEEFAAARVQAARASNTELLEAKAARLKAEIDLLVESENAK